MFASLLLLFGGIFTTIFIILLVPDLPITFHDVFVFFVYVFVLFLFPVSLFAMVSPGTMSSIYNKAKAVITGTGQQTQVAQGNAYRTFNIFSVTIGFMAVFGFIVVLLMYGFNVKIKHESKDTKNNGDDETAKGKGRLCETKK